MQKIEMKFVFIQLLQNTRLLIVYKTLTNLIL